MATAKMRAFLSPLLAASASEGVIESRALRLRRPPVPPISLSLLHYQNGKALYCFGQKMHVTDGRITRLSSPPSISYIYRRNGSLGDRDHRAGSDQIGGAAEDSLALTTRQRTCSCVAYRQILFAVVACTLSPPLFRGGRGRPSIFSLFSGFCTW